MSILITIIIMFSTIPLVKSAGFILLQRTPPSVSVELLRKDILTIPGIIDVHELHVWQLSDSKIVASVHIVVPRPAVGSVDTLMMEERYMILAAAIKAKLHVP
jgi:zinc transporter 1